MARRIRPPLPPRGEKRQTTSRDDHDSGRAAGDAPLSRRQRFYRFVATGGLAVALGVPIFYTLAIPLSIVLLIAGAGGGVFHPGPMGAGGGESDWILFFVLGLLACAVSFLVPWLVGGFSFAERARWACLAGYFLVWMLHLPFLVGVVLEPSRITFFLLLFPLLFTFWGGDLGDRRRERKRLARMRREAEEDDRAFDEELRRRAGWKDDPAGAEAASARSGAPPVRG